MNDVRDTLFQGLSGRVFHAVLTAERSGVLAGCTEAMAAAGELGIPLEICCKEGEELSHGVVFAHLSGTAKQIALAEEHFIALLAKASGVATAARTAVMIADGRAKIISGAWKKMPMSVKSSLRHAVAVGGAGIRVTEQPMLYIDKNYVRMLGGVGPALEAARFAADLKKVVQIRGELTGIEEETRQAVEGGAGMLMVDTGSMEDGCLCAEVLRHMGCREQIELVFAGGVTLDVIPHIIETVEPDIIAVGRAIIDAPLLDMRLDVIRENRYER